LWQRNPKLPSLVRGSSAQTRLAVPYMERLHLNDMETQLEPIFVYFKQSRQLKGLEVFAIALVSSQLGVCGVVRVPNCC